MQSIAGGEVKWSDMVQPISVSATVAWIPPTTGNIDSLLRFFKSEYFKSRVFYLMHYLYHDERTGIQDYLVNQLYEKEDHEVDFYF